jgi:hypothetical protein
MAYDIRLVKLVNGETVLGKIDEDGKKLKDVAILQTVPTQQGVQMLILPFGYPFETEVGGEIAMDHVLYEFKKCPEEIKTKYLEATSNLTLSTAGDLRTLKTMAAGTAAKGGLGGLIRK